MNAFCLGSSSSGNCFILELEVKDKSIPIMVECGFSYKEILTKCNMNNILISNIRTCLITHAHNDHCKAATDLLKRGFKIYCSKETAKEISKDCDPLVINTSTKIEDGIFVIPFLVNHDISGACGFIIKTAKETILFINDCKSWGANLSEFKFDYVFIECNYDHEVVYAQYHELKNIIHQNGIEQSTFMESVQKLKQHERNINSHMSLSGTIKNLTKLNLVNCKSIFLMHLSDRFANEYKMKNAVQNSTKIKTFVCKKNGGIK